MVREQRRRALARGRSVGKYPIRYSRIRGTRHWSRRPLPEGRIFSPDFSRAGSATSRCTCAILHYGRNGRSTSLEIYNVRNKILVKPLCRSITRLYAPSIRQFRGIFACRQVRFHYFKIITCLM